MADCIGTLVLLQSRWSNLVHAVSVFEGKVFVLVRGEKASVVSRLIMRRCETRLRLWRIIIFLKWISCWGQVFDILSGALKRIRCNAVVLADLPSWEKQTRMPIETCVAILVALHKNAVSNDRDSCHDVLQELGNLKKIDRLWASQTESHQASSHEKDKYDGKECRFEPEFVLKVGVMSSLLCDCGQLGINYAKDCYE